MNLIIGTIVMFGCVLGGYVLHGGKLGVLWQPTEVLIIFGAALAAFIIGNSGGSIKEVGKAYKRLFKGMPFKRDDYTELLTMMYAVFKTMRSKGMLEMEQHIENPHDSALFSAYPKFHHNHHATEFFCTYLRLMTMGVEDYYQQEELMDRELDMHKKHGEHVSHVMTLTAEAMPALGIVAAVLGVIITMGSISEPPEILGGLIGAALVGTFLGVWMSYGFFGPMANYVNEAFAFEYKYLRTIRVGLLAHLQGHAPAVSVEFARNSIEEGQKPAFADIEEACANVTL